MKFYLWILIGFFAVACSSDEEVVDRPNVVLVMCDDLGWGDTGFNGNTTIQTPHLDMLALKGMIFNRFYTASPVCSPTRASCLTGRNPYRMNIPTANSGFMKTAEVTLAEILRKNNYHTGFFGKWHLGTLTTKMNDANRGRPGNYDEFSIPSQHGFDVFFATESKVPTYDPMIKPGMYHEKLGESPRFGWEHRSEEDSVEAFGTYYWEGKEKRVREGLLGDDAKIIMDRALDFIYRRSSDIKPFFVVIWLHTPHLPVVASDESRKPYSDYDLKEQLYYGTISAMDEQIGRLWTSLQDLDESDNTMLWFCSDNGPENGTPGLSGPFRERKRSLYEGGVRVPAFCVWPNGIESGKKLDFPMITSDYLPTILDMLSISHATGRPLDGISVLPAINGTMKNREKPMGFLFRDRISWVNHQYKLISTDRGETYELYDLLIDPGEQNDIAAANSDLVAEMRKELARWRSSVEHSRTGGDY